jgi:hypothetical protein
VHARRPAFLPQTTGRQQRGSAMFAAKSHEAEQELPEGIPEPRNVTATGDFEAVLYGRRNRNDKGPRCASIRNEFIGGEALSGSGISLILAAWKMDLLRDIRCMSEKPKFHTRMIKDSRWTVAVATGYGPATHVGKFATEEEAQRWISTKSKDWTHSPDDPK